MKGYNIIAIFNRDLTKVLLCKREKEPYKGLYNLVGGKVEEGEEGQEAAYRELYEETGITEKSIELKHLMDFTYYTSEIHLETYVGRLNTDVNLVEEVNKLKWIDVDSNFFDVTIFAGNGNIGHILREIEFHKEKIWNK